jgi:hypothetical protein
MRQAPPASLPLRDLAPRRAVKSLGAATSQLPDRRQATTGFAWGRPAFACYRLLIAA